MTIADSLHLHGKVALVCGAGRGLGRAIAEALSEAGADVAAVSRGEAEVAALAAELRANGAAAQAFATDMTVSAAVDTMVQDVLKQMGRIDILFNVVGQNMHRAVVDTTDEEWDRALSTNLTSAFYSCRAVGRHMLARGEGCVVNVSSTAGLRGRAQRTAYSAAKAAVIQFSRSLAMEWAPMGLRVNVLCPGRFYTSSTADEDRDSKRHAQLLEKIPLRRIASTEEIKAAAVFLASPASAYATGSVLVLDGGQSIS